ncbi:MAG: DUF4199 domain-containing protein [Rhodanobacteraceae bacterium]
MFPQPKSFIRVGLVFGIISGMAVILPTQIAMGFSATRHLLGSEVVGYLVMLIALSLIFVGIKRHRDQALGGVIGFPRALLLGLLISLVASLIYVASWEFYLYRTDYAFINNYVAHMIEARRQAGLTAQALAAEMARLETLKANYGKPLYRMFITFTEIFPVGALVSLASAALLRFPGVLPRQRATAA